MPPPKTKQAKGNAVKKEQIAEKVKEIQQRQKNWMRQRDEHLKTGSDYDNTDTVASEEHYSLPEAKNGSRRQYVEHTAQGADILRVHHDSSSQHLASQVSDKLNVKVKHGFGAWLQSRQHSDHNTEDHTHSNMHNINEDYSSGTHSSINNFQGEKPASVSSNGVSAPPHSSNRSYPLSPAEFNSLADNIAARVKKDLGIKHGNGARLHEGEEAVEENFRRRKTFVQELSAEQNVYSGGGGVGVGDDEGSVDVSSHQCPFCSSLMATSAHVPMLLVPCGHTVCKRCSTSHTSCRLCGTKVGSLTTNIMLQQIIQEFHRKSHKGNKETSSLPATAQVTREREGSLPAIPPKTVSYCSQLQSLQERRATLEEEARSCRKERDHITSKVKRAEKQMKAIEREEQSMEHQIQQLQEQLKGLREHKEEYSGDYHHLQDELKAASNQVTLVEQTLRSLGEEIDKLCIQILCNVQEGSGNEFKKQTLQVQFLAEGQEDGYLQRHSHYR